MSTFQQTHENHLFLLDNGDLRVAEAEKAARGQQLSRGRIGFVTGHDEQRERNAVVVGVLACPAQYTLSIDVRTLHTPVLQRQNGLTIVLQESAARSDFDGQTNLQALGAKPERNETLDDNALKSNGKRSPFCTSAASNENERSVLHFSHANRLITIKLGAARRRARVQIGTFRYFDLQILKWVHVLPRRFEQILCACDICLQTACANYS